MVMFWVSAGVLTLATLLLVLFPLFRRSGQRTDRAAYGAHVFRDQLAEIERDVEQGFLSADQGAVASSEINRRLLAVADSVEEKFPGIRRSLGWTMIAAIALAVPAGIFSVYMMLGAPDLPDNPLAGRADEVKRAGEIGDMMQMAENLSARLEENPKDVEGWLMLGRTYRTMGHMKESTEAFSRAYALNPEIPVIATSYGEALVIVEKGHVSKTARKAFETALTSDPKDIKGRYYLGLAMSQTLEELPEAIEMWSAIVKDASPEAQWVAAVQDQIKRAKESLKNGAAAN